jgi:hypothetical protein
MHGCLISVIKEDSYILKPLSCCNSSLLNTTLTAMLMPLY